MSGKSQENNMKTVRDQTLSPNILQSHYLIFFMPCLGISPLLNRTTAPKNQFCMKIIVNKKWTLQGFWEV
jgi:hypothetical protein